MDFSLMLENKEIKNKIIAFIVSVVFMLLIFFLFYLIFFLFTRETPEIIIRKTINPKLEFDENHITRFAKKYEKGNYLLKNNKNEKLGDYYEENGYVDQLMKNSASNNYSNSNNSNNSSPNGGNNNASSFSHNNNQKENQSEEERRIQREERRIQREKRRKEAERKRREALEKKKKLLLLKKKNAKTFVGGSGEMKVLGAENGIEKNNFTKSFYKVILKTPITNMPINQKREVIAAVINGGDKTIPNGSIVKGIASFNSERQRIDIVFSSYTQANKKNIVLPISAIALSNSEARLQGLSCEYNDEMLKKKGGEFLDNVINKVNSMALDKSSGFAPSIDNLKENSDMPTCSLDINTIFIIGLKNDK